MNKEIIVDKIDDIIMDMNIYQYNLKKIGIESNYVYQAEFERMYNELDKIRDRLFEISNELFGRDKMKIRCELCESLFWIGDLIHEIPNQDNNMILICDECHKLLNIKPLHFEE